MSVAQTTLSQRHSWSLVQSFNLLQVFWTWDHKETYSNFNHQFRWLEQVVSNVLCSIWTSSDWLWWITADHLTGPVWYRHQTLTQRPRCESLKSSSLIWTSQVSHLEPFHSSFRSSINCTTTVCKNEVQLCRCHHQTITCCWEKTALMVKTQPETTKNQVCNESEAAGRQVYDSTVRCALHQPELRGCCADRTSWSRHKTLKLDWRFLLIMWTEKKPSGGKFVWPQRASTCSKFTRKV